jgi:hypothetical protein
MAEWADAIGARQRTKHSTEGAMDRYTIDPNGAWRHYHPRPVPKGWRMLGTVRCQSDDSIGALVRSPAGLFAQINAGGVRVLDQRAVADALRRVKVP